MKRVIAVSDSHGCASALREAFELAWRSGPVDVAVFLGDGLSDYARLEGELIARGALCYAVQCDRFFDALSHLVFPLGAYAVRGNNDWSASQPREVSFTVGGVRFYACHGHEWHVKYGLDRLWYAARECGAQVALYGHTHRADVELERGMYLVNPGAVCEKYRGCAAYADIRVEDNGGVRVALQRWE